jgi:RHS repeat-associated protein
VLLSRKPTAPIVLEDTKSGAAVDITLQDALDVEAESADGFLVYQQGHASGATVMHRALPDGDEDFLSFEQRPANTAVSYRIGLQNGIGGLRLVANTLELLDAQGAPRLRIAPPYVIGADRTRIDATLAVEGCQVDTDPAPPWDRPVTAPGATTCTVHVSWPSEGVTYPALLDPKWTTTADMVKKRNGHTATVLPTGRVLVAGGTDGATVFSSAELYDRTTGTWSSTGSMTGARKYQSAVLLNTSSNTTTSGKVLIAGGANSSSALSTAQLYSPSTGQWISAGTMNASRYQHTATLLSNGRVLVAGGVSGSTVLNTAAVYNPSSGSGTWAGVSSMAVSRRWHTATLLSTTNATLNNKVLVVGGNSGSNSLTSVQLFDGTSSWSTLTSLSSSRQEHSATRLTDGRLLVAGGKSGSTTLNSALLFNPATGSGSWASAGTMTSRRHGQSDSLLPTSVVTNGQVLLAGGWDGNITVSSAELFTAPATWTATNAMPEPMKYHTASVLSNGMLLIAGGVEGSTPLDSAHLYDPSRGLPCSSSSQCPTGFCANGVCCDTACIDECGACNLTGLAGTCSAKPNGIACADEGNPCTVDQCNGSSKLCQHPAGNAGATCRVAINVCDVAETCSGTSATCPTDAKAPGGTPCDDGIACSTGDTCNGAGTCVGGPPLPVDDDNPCTTDGCGPGGPVHTPLPLGTSCNSLCVTGGVGTCDSSGTCVGGTPVECPADACHGPGACSPSTGLCTNPTYPDGTACDDGRVCTTGDACQNGICASNTACTADCPCGPGKTCTSDTECVPGLVCGQQNGRFFGKDPLSSNCWPPACPSSPQTLGCGHAFSPCGACPPAPPRTCTSDTECQPTNEICGQSNGAAFGLGNLNVCWPPICPGGQTACGSPLAPCGACSCVNTCGSKTCSTPDKSDGCGGYCVGLCGDGQAGCTFDADCRNNSLCREGMCVPPACTELDTSRSCPVNHPSCPTCPQCQSQCASAGLTCGPDPAGCAASCGTCEPGSACLRGKCFGPVGPVRPVSETTAVGALDGTFAVSDSGQAQYTIPIAVPPNRAGAQPTIAISYASDKQLGPAGLGWRITGFSTIARCTTRVNGADPQPLRYTNDDWLCIDGKRLIPLQPGPAAAGKEYRTAVDEFSRIVVVGVDDGGPTSFKVYRKAGTILTYGGQDNATVYYPVETAAGPSIRRRSWAIARVDDRNGNSVHYRYETRRDTLDMVGWLGGPAVLRDSVEMIPQEVSYGSNEAATPTIPATRSVQFLYDDVGVRSFQFSAGGASRTQRQLREIRTYEHNELARMYRFEYENKGLIFRLLRAKECAPVPSGGEVCKPATSFEYDNGPAFLPGIKKGGAFAYWHAVAADLDGDGDDDWKAQGTLAIPPGPTDTVVTWNGNAMDLNNDGSEELLSVPVHPGNVLTVWAGPPPSPTKTEYHFATIGNWQPNYAYPADLDGDGIRDILVCRRPLELHPVGPDEVGYLKVNPDSNSTDLGQVIPLPKWGFCEARYPLFVDVDGDGVANLIRADSTPTSRQWKALVVRRDPISGADQSEWVNIGFSPHPSRPYFPSRYQTLDVNGDGLTDVLGNDDDPTRPATLWINQGDRLFRPTDGTAGPQLAMDIDGDGNQEIVHQRDIVRWLPPSFAPQVESSSSIIVRFNLKEQVPNFGPLVGHFSPFLVDDNGDGDPDLVQPMVSSGGTFQCEPGGRRDDPFYGCPPMVSHGRTRRMHLLRGVVDGLGRRVDVVYDGRATQTSPAACRGSSELLCPRKFPPLVSEHRVSTIEPGAIEPTPRRAFLYTYADARAGTKGRGEYGFGRRTIEQFERIDGPAVERLASTTELVYFNTDATRAGLIESRTVTTGQPTQGVAGFVDPAKRRVKELFAYQERVNEANGDIKFPVLRSSTRKIFDVTESGEQIVSSEANEFTSDGDIYADYDNYGNSKHHHRQVFVGENQPVSFTVTGRDFKPADENNWLVGLISRVQVSDSRNSIGETRVQIFEYEDASGRLLKRTRDPGGPAQRVERFSYTDAVHNLTEHILQPGDENERITVIAYDPATLTFPQVTLNALAQPTTTTFDRRHGGLISTMDANGLIETRTYDAFGRLTKVQGPTGTVRMTLARGDDDRDPYPPPDARAVMRVFTEELSTSGQSVGAMKAEDFGSLGEILKRAVTGYESSPGIDQWVEETFAYDPVGRLRFQTRPHLAGAASDQGTIEFRYDGTGQLIEEIYPGDPNAGGPTSIYHASGTRNTWVEDITFSNFASSVEIVSQRVNSTTGAPTAFDTGSVRFGDPEGLTVSTRDAAHTYTEYARGAFGQLSRVEVGRNIGGGISTIEYHPYGLKRRLSHPDLPNQGVETYLYDAFDQLREQTDARGFFTRYEFDQLGRMIDRQAFDPNLPEPIEVTRWHYDHAGAEPAGPNEIGRLVQVLSGSSADPFRYQTRYAYQTGSFGLLEGVQRAIGAEGFSTTFSYDDDFHRLEGIQYPTTGGSFVVEQTFDSRGNLIKVLDGIPPPQGSPPKPSYWQVTSTSQGYRIESEAFGNNAVTTTTYEPLTGRLKTVRTVSDPGPNPVAIEGFEYAYLPNGNLATRTNTEAPRVDQFGYDHLDRLKFINNTQVVTYDFQGRILTKEDVGTYAYDPTAGPLHAPRTITENGVTRNFFYDASGNERERTDGPEGIRTTEYNSFNLPNIIIDTLPATSTTTFEYDGDQSRVAKTETSETGQRLTVYAGGIYERVTDNAGGTPVVTHKYFVFASGKQVAQVERTPGVPGDNIMYLHGDHLGSTQLITRGTPEPSSEFILHQQSFDPWGKPEGTAAWNSTNASVRNVRAGFTGHEHDPQHSLINMRGRMYDPELGRFMSPDPFVPAPLYSQSFDRYAYVLNNPLRFVDPTGFLEEYSAHGGGKSERGSATTSWLDKTIRAIGRFLGIGSNAPTTPPPQPENPSVGTKPEASKSPNPPQLVGPQQPPPPPIGTPPPGFQMPLAPPATAAGAMISSSAAFNGGGGAAGAPRATGARGAGGIPQSQPPPAPPPFHLSQVVAVGDVETGNLDLTPGEMRDWADLVNAGKVDAGTEPEQTKIGWPDAFPAGPLGAAAGAVEAYEVGRFGQLVARSVKGDAIALHHAGQAHALEQLIPGYSRATAPTIALPQAEHALIPNLRGAVTLTPRQVLARDIWNLRQLTNAPNSALRELIQLNKELYPGAFLR